MCRLRDQTRAKGCANSADCIETRFTEFWHPRAQHRSDQTVGIQNDRFAAHAITDVGSLGS